MYLFMQYGGGDISGKSHELHKINQLLINLEVFPFPILLYNFYLCVLSWKSCQMYPVSEGPIWSFYCLFMCNK